MTDTCVQTRSGPIVFGSLTEFSFQPFLPSIEAVNPPLYPKYKTPQQRKTALLSFTKTLHLTSLPIKSHEILLSALTYPNRVLFPRLGNLCLGEPRYRPEPHPNTFRHVFGNRIPLAPALLMSLRLLKPKRLCIRELSYAVIHEILSDVTPDESENDPAFNNLRTQSITIHPHPRILNGPSCTQGYRSSFWPGVLSVPGVDMVYDASRYAIREDPTSYIIAALERSRERPARSYTFLDMARCRDGLHPLEVAEYERDMIKGVKERLKAYGDAAWLDELDEKVRFWFGRDFGRHGCCGYEVQGGHHRREHLPGGRGYMKLSDVEY
jgi:hypothetical protein